MSAGSTGYDIIVPTDATLVKMKHADLVEPLDLSEIPNVVNLDERFRNAAYDPGNKYSIPWQWGTTGIGFDKTKVTGEVTDWDAFNLAARGFMDTGLVVVEPGQPLIAETRWQWTLS